MACEEIAPCFISSIMLLFLSVIVPICCYSTYCLYRYRNHQHIQPRYPTFIVILSLLSIFTVLTKDLTLFLSIFTTHNDSMIINLIFEPFSLSIALGMLVRVWLINYDINYAVWQAQHKWQSLLQNELKSNDNWYAAHKQKYGNWKYMFGIATLAFIVLSIAIISINDNFVSNILCIAVLSLITLSNFGIVLCKIPSFNDQVFIRREVTLIICVNLVCIALYSISALITFNVYGTDSHIAIVINNIALTLYNVSIPLISTVWVLYQFRKSGTDLMIIDEIPFAIDRHSPYSLKDTKSNLSLKIHKKQPSKAQITVNYLSPNKLFRLVLSNDLALSAFMIHLQAEFSMENVLSFIELVQWTYEVTQKEWDEYDIKPIKIDFADTVPISSINKDPTLSWFEKIGQLNEKYIAEHCEYEVNIPYGLRSAMRNLISLMNKQQKRMDDIMNKREIRRRTTTNSTQAMSYNTIATQSTVGSTATTLTSSNTRKSRVGTLTTTVTTTNTPDMPALNPQNTSGNLTVPRQGSNQSLSPITPYHGPSVPNIVEAIDENDEFVIDTGGSEDEEEAMVFMDNYSDYKSPKKQVNNDEISNVKSGQTNQKILKKLRMQNSASETEKTNTSTNSKRFGKKLALQKADSTPNSVIRGKSNKRSVFALKMSHSNSELELAEHSKSKSHEIKIDLGDLELDCHNSANAHLGVPKPQLPAVSHSLDLRETDSKNKSKLTSVPLREIVSENRGHRLAKSSDAINEKYTRHIMRESNKKNMKFSAPKISNIKHRISARFSSLGLFSKNAAKKPKNIETEMDDSKESMNNNTPKPREVGLKDFVHIVNEIIMVVQSLNHQSIMRWRKTAEFMALKENVDFGVLASHMPTPTSNKSVNAINNNLNVQISNAGLKTPSDSNSKRKYLD